MSFTSPRGAAAGTEGGKEERVKAQFVVWSGCKLKGLRRVSRTMTCVEYCHNVINFRHVLQEWDKI